MTILDILDVEKVLQEAAWKLDDLCEANEKTDEKDRKMNKYWLAGAVETAINHLKAIQAVYDL